MSKATTRKKSTASTKKTQAKGKGSKPKYITKTLRGIARYPHLVKPDTKFKADGEYKVDLIVPHDQAEPMIKFLQEYYEEQFEEKSAELLEEKDREAIKQPMPWSREKDDEGEPTGNIIFKIRKNGVRNLKDGGTEPVKIPLQDSLGRSVNKKVKRLYGGSDLNVAFNPSVWVNPKGEVGLKLYIVAVQIVKLVQEGSGFSFGAIEDEDGFSADDLNEDQDIEDNEEDEAEDLSGDEDGDEEDDF